jgi:ribosomal peptide maturation radical SAM protein 1
MDVLLACMPFGPVFSPALGLSLLKTRLHDCGIDSSIRYFSLSFAELIGQHVYCGIAEGERPPVIDLAGDWIFSASLSSSERDDEYVDRILRAREGWRDADVAPPVSDATIRRIQRARDRADAFLDACVAEVVAARPRILGFSSVFQQHVASLALARRVKAALPDTFIVLGGANCEAVMGAETVRQFPFVDAAVSGEGEVIFPELVRRVLAGNPVDDLAGVYTRRSIRSAFAFGNFANAPALESMDDLPFPDFSDYMAQFASSRFDRDWHPTLPFETSRGCWWGAKHHCTFCGLNGSSMAFRSKSATRAIDELIALTRRYPGCDVQVVDNILDMEYFKTFLPELARRKPGVSLFYETKANLRKDQIRILRDAGVNAIQPGIESFSDPVLKLMRKGVSGLQNVQLLKWCRELGVHPIWNVIWGFPGEPQDDYARMTALVGKITHLPPPQTFEGLRLDRFSPNYVEAESFGFADVRPAESYRYVYALPDAAIANLAYFFQFRARDGSDPVRPARPLLRALRAWKRNHRRSELVSMDVDGHLLVWRARPRRAGALRDLTGVDRAIYLACDRIADFATLADTARRLGCDDESEVRRRLEWLVSEGLLIVDGDRYLALAIPVGEYRPAARNVPRGPAWRRPLSSTRA